MWWSSCELGGSKVHEVAASKSTEAEYVAISRTIQEGLYLSMLEKEMGVDGEGGRALTLVDNK